ncbi:uncharacterized protein G2W53_015451 [Senna tora]|uniref:Uncharacterized protein n=1 Tax=Senna tora TaxID=362788 RepID=A0A834WVI2_9FABA|nr:uncharacterized protein G2W53_015451 [Senna tora]
MRKKKSIREEIVPDFSHDAIFSPVRSHLHGADDNAPSHGAVVTPFLSRRRVQTVVSSSLLLLLSRTKAGLK